MVSWYLASHGKVTGPLSIAEARSAIESNNRKDPQFFVWQPNFVYWQPAYSVSEFSDIVPEIKHATPVFDGLKERERILSDRVEYIDEKLKQTYDNMMAFEDDVIAYQKLTANFGPEVQTAIAAIEKKFHSLNKKVAEIDSATEIAKNEIANVRKAFATDDTSKVNGVAANNAQTAEQKNVDDKNIAVNASQPKPQQTTPLARAEAEVATQPKTTSQPEVAADTSEQDANSKGILGMKSMFKSVFKDPEPEQRLSEVIKQTETSKAVPEEPKEEDIELVVIDDEESIETVKKRRRRRRR